MGNVVLSILVLGTLKYLLFQIQIEALDKKIAIQSLRLPPNGSRSHPSIYPFNLAPSITQSFKSPHLSTFLFEICFGTPSWLENVLFFVPLDWAS